MPYSSRWMRSDSDLDPLRDDPRFEHISGAGKFRGATRCGKVSLFENSDLP